MDESCIKQGQVTAEATKAAESTEILIKRLAGLEQRLGVILRGTSSLAEKPQEKPTNLVELAGLLWNVNKGLSHVLQTIDDIITRLEL
ncbi:MAG: hypothetical protein FJZ89_13030 [Chloroflexi bacterium]|nr:hypothetical protein [Chloroflexota bacterium]